MLSFPTGGSLGGPGGGSACHSEPWNPEAPPIRREDRCDDSTMYCMIVALVYVEHMQVNQYFQRLGGTTL